MGHYPRPAPNIIRTEDGEGWLCTQCNNVDCCVCLGGMSDPICDCGWPGYACQCGHDEDEKRSILDNYEETCSW
jgi:hypothetical protein